MTEQELQAAIAELCLALGLFVYHTYNSRRSKKGFPDLVIVGPGGVLWRELKTATGRPTPEQVDVLARLTAAGQDAAIWRPTDLTSGAVVHQLTAIRRSHAPARDPRPDTGVRRAATTAAPHSETEDRQARRTRPLYAVQAPASDPVPRLRARHPRTRHPHRPAAADGVVEARDERRHRPDL